jgi:hypothetical protein|tara:strand:+ start:476 stop:994 length:519 start_codon:yes stop_codon:yes gene_type:complete
MKHITKKRLEKILISLIKKVDHRASNIRVATAKSSLGETSMIKVDHVDKNFPELDKFNIDWVCFGIDQDGKLFYHVDGLEGRGHFGEQDYSADLQIAWSYVQQELAKYNSHSESRSGYDGSVEEIYEGTNLTQKDLEENVFDRKPSEATQKHYAKAFENDYGKFLKKECETA